MQGEECGKAIEAVGSAIRAMKAAKKDKVEVTAAVAELNALKARFEAVTGTSWSSTPNKT